MSRFIKKRRTRCSRLWLAVFGVMSMGFIPFGMCDDNGGDFDCGDSDCDTDCDTDNDGDCDCDHHDSDDSLYESAIRDSWYHYYTPGPNQAAKTTSSRNVKEKDELKSRLRKKRIIAFLFKRKKVQVGFSSGNLLEQNATKAQQMMKEQAFTKIKLVPVLDIGPKSRTRAGKVKEVTIGDQSVFVKTDMFPYDAPITIYYHDKKEVTIPYSAKSLRKQNYQAVYEQLQELGFTNLHKCPKKDIVLGWLSKEGEVEEVCIAGNNRFKENTTYKFDVEVLIHYHLAKFSKQ